MDRRSSVGHGRRSVRGQMNVEEATNYSNQNGYHPHAQAPPPGYYGGATEIEDDFSDNEDHLMVRRPEDEGQRMSWSHFVTTMKEKLGSLKALLVESIAKKRPPPVRKLSEHFSSLTRVPSRLIVEVASGATRAAETAVKAAASNTYDYMWSLYISTAAVWGFATFFLLMPIVLIYVVTSVSIDWDSPYVKLFLNPLWTGVAVSDYLCAALLLNYPLFWLLQFAVQTSSFYSFRQVGLSITRISSAFLLVFSTSAAVAHAVPRPVLLALLLTYTASTGLWYCITVDFWRFYKYTVLKEGLLQYLPRSIQRLLLDRTLLEWLTDSSFVEQMKIYVPFFLGLNKLETRTALDNMPQPVRKRLMRRGLLGVLPKWFQRILYPNYEEADPSGTRQPQPGAPPGSAQSTIARSIAKNGANITSHAPISENDRGFVFSRKRSTDALLVSVTEQSMTKTPTKTVVSRRRRSVVTTETFLMKLLHDRVARVTSGFLMSFDETAVERLAMASVGLTLLQLFASKEARGNLIAVARTASVVGTALVAISTLWLRLAQMFIDPSYAEERREITLFAMQLYIKMKGLLTSSKKRLTKGDTERPEHHQDQTSRGNPKETGSKKVILGSSRRILRALWHPLSQAKGARGGWALASLFICSYLVIRARRKRLSGLT